MPTLIELRAEPRSVLGKHVRRLRREGLVPANIYAHGVSRPIQAPLRDFDHMLAHGGRTGVVSIVFDGSTETALLKEIQRDPRSGKLLHAQFQAVSMEESVTGVVPVRFVGESEAVSKQDGVMMHPKSELHVTARARDLPELIEVDVSVLVELHSSIKVSDLPASATYTIIDSGDDLLAIVLPPKVEAGEVEEAEEAAAAEAEGAAATQGESPSADAAAESSEATDSA